MTPVVFKMFCHQVAGQADAPGKSVKVVNLQNIIALPDVIDSSGKKVPGKPSPNAPHYNNGVGSCNFSAAGVTREFTQLFEEGKRYKVTIEEDTDVV